VHNGDFRSLKTDDVYTITLERALEILAEPKKFRFGRKPKTATEGANDSKPAASKVTEKEDKK
jgi:topoisomerase IA-like protein